MMTTMHQKAMGTWPGGEVVCNAFLSNIFKPDYCTHCFKARTAHVNSAMPLQNNMPNGHHRGSKKDGSNGLPNTANVWIKKETGVTDYRQQNDSNHHQAFPTNRSCQNAKEQSTHSEKRGVQAKSAVENGVGNKRVGSTSGGIFHSHEYNPNVYEAIYPTSDTIESFDNQANSILETSHMKQRSLSDVRSTHCVQNKDVCRRVSSPFLGVADKNKFTEGKQSNSNVYEFQKLAGHLKHTNRKEAAPLSGDCKTAIPQCHQKKKIPSRCGYSQVNKIGAGIKNADKKPMSYRRNFPENNSSADLQVRSGGNNNKRNNKTDSPSSSCSKAAIPNEEEVVAPVVPVRSDSMRKKTSAEPGFALECFVPDRITIISADGSKEVVTSDGHSHTTVPPTDPESNTEAIKQTNKSKLAARSKSSPQITLPKEPNKGSTSNSSVPKPPSEPPLEAIPYEIMTVGPIHQNNGILESNQGSPRECTNKANAASTPENLLPSKQEKSTSSVIPPFPVILHSDQENKAKDRHSGNYKVEIFIKHQDYDNFGTVLADQVYESMQLKQSDNKADVSSMSDTKNGLVENQYYLKPTEREEQRLNGTASSQEKLITEDEYEVVGQAKTHPQQTPVEEKSETSVSQERVKNIPTKPPRRSRSQTHPLVCQDGQPADNESPSSQSTPEVKSKMKRTAPRPPVISREDTMPRMPPPPPPTDKARRLSKDLQEGIIRYHCSASPVTNRPKSKNHSNTTKASPIFQKKFVNSEAKLSPTLISPGGATDAKLVTVKEDDEHVTTNSSTTRGSKEKGKPSLAVSPSKGRSAPKPMISPPKTHLLHHLEESPPSSTGHESKQKERKSLMFWKKLRRKESEGSPEREYNTDIVTQWLEKLGCSPPMTQRHSWERMEVINAYKGQETAVIGYKGQQDGSVLNNNPEISAKRKAPKPPKAVTVSSDSSSQLSPETTDGKVLCKDTVKEQQRRNSESIITANGNKQDGREQTDGQLEVPPRRTRSQRRRSHTVHEIPEYVNIAFMKQNKTPPTKPHRRVRGSRSLTTGFENLPSVTKRLAPKNPEEDAESKMNAARSSASDQGSVSQGAKDFVQPQTLDPQTPPESQAPLKSALKKMSIEGETDQCSNKDKPPRRPVRLIHANSEFGESDNQYGLPKSGYVNLEVKQVDLFKGVDEKETGRLLSSASSLCPDSNIILAQVQSMQCETLCQAGELYPQPFLHKSMFQDKTWDDFTIHERTVIFADEKTFCFRAELKENHQVVCLMVFLHERMLDQIFEAACELESFPPHPNMLNIVHTFKTTLSANLFNNSQDEASQSNYRDSPCNQSEVVVVVTSQIPTSTASLFLDQSCSAESREQYEEEVWIMVLQVCRGVAHAQKYEPDLSLEGLKQESVLQMRPGSRLWLFNPLVVSTLSIPSTGRRDSVASHLTDKCCEFDLGILIYELLGQPNPFTVRTSLMSRNYTPDELPPISGLTPYSSKLKALVCECLRRCPEERINMAQALWIVNALTFCPNLVSRMDSGDILDIPRLNHLILMKQTELVCGLAAQRSIAVEFMLWEKLELLFWGEVNGIKLERALQTLRG